MGYGQRHRSRQKRRPANSPTPEGDYESSSIFLLPDKQVIHVYKDRDGVLVTDDMGGSRRPVDDVIREAMSNLRMRLGDPLPLRKDKEQNVLASKDLLDTTTLEESSITKASPQPTSREDIEPNVLASKELLDITTLEDSSTTLEESSITNASSLPQPTPHEDRAPNVFASKELLDTTTLEESSITSTSSLPLSIPSGSGYAYHYLALHEPDMLSSKELSIVMETLGKSSITDASSTRGEAVTHLPTPPISARKPAGWNHQFFIRVDSWGIVYTYPGLSGPFWSLDEAEDAILCHLDKLRDPKMCTNNGLSRSEIAIRKALYWPDGKRKHSSRSNPDEDHMKLLVQALLDKHNEENKLLGDLAYQVKDVVSFQEVYEGDGGWYYHLNCTRKTKDGVDKIFFAEVLKMISGKFEEFKLTCLHMVKPGDDGPCYGCTKDDIGMKHPIDAGKYKGGHDPSWPRDRGCHPLRVLPEDMHARMKYQEERIRYMYQDRGVAKLDAGKRTDAGLDKSQGRLVRTTTNAGWDRGVAKSNAGTRTNAGPDKSQGRLVRTTTDAGRDKSKESLVKYVVPARRQLVLDGPSCLSV